MPASPRLKETSFSEQVKSKSLNLYKKAIKSIKRKPKFIGWLLRLINLVFTIGLLISYASSSVDPLKFPLIALFGLVFPLWLTANIIFAIFWSLRLRWFALVPIIAIAIGYKVIGYHLQFSSTKTTEIRGSGIRIISYNVRTFQGTSESNPETIYDDISEWCSSHQPDIVCLQEFLARSKEMNALTQKFMKLNKMQGFTYRNYFPNESRYRVACILTFSKFPIVKTDYLEFEGRRFALITDLVRGMDTIRVVNVHLRSNQISDTDIKFIDDLTQLEGQQSPVKTRSLKIFGKITGAFKVRSHQIAILKKELSNSPHPVIIAGDFNDTPASYVAGSMREIGLSDAFTESGRGYGNTYGGALPPIRIDYIYSDKHFKPYNYQTGYQPFSDHYPIQAWLKPTW